MLVPDELKRYGFQRKLKLIEQIWLDYLQDHLLVLLYREYPDFIFRGGTCIWKVYDGERFSEDLDLARENIPENITRYLTKELELLGFTVTVSKERETDNMYHLRLGFDRPDASSTTPVSIEILKDSTPNEKIVKREIHSPYPDIPKVDVRTLTQNALLGEKISTVLQRNRPRDMHDIYRLLREGATLDSGTWKEQTKGLGIEEFEKSLDKKESGWRGLRSLMVGDLPGFEKEKEYIIRKLWSMIGED